MIVNLLNKVGVVLKTLNKYCKEDITVVPKLQNLTITENGSYGPGEGYAGIGEVNVNVVGKEFILQDKTVEITTNGSTVIRPDNGCDGLSKVTIIMDVPTTDLYFNAEGVGF